ncbi:MAG: hypothetical protein JO104_05935 [Candidatus Eremiobacteraeota bacterium]|nr:hypothetical protein [Candidatus Eremiobacteraeota bacterium]
MMRGSRSIGFAFVAVIGALALSACTGAFGVPSSLPARAVAPSRAAEFLHAGPQASKIAHIIIIIQENRSFNDLFMGYPGATTAAYGYDSHNNKIALKPAGLEAHYDLEHSAKGFLVACNGTGKIPGTNCRMNGFSQETVTCGGSGQPPCPFKHPQYAYVPRDETVPYWDIAGQYVLADQTYSSAIDAASFSSHQYIIAGQAESTVNIPLTQWGCGGGPTDKIARIGPQRQLPWGNPIRPCFDDDTIGQEADNAGISWAFYTSKIGRSGGIWSGYQANHYVYHGPDWKNDVITPQTQFFNDVANGKLRQISWITPTAADSDHPGFGTKLGPMWVASLVNAVGESQYWNSTAIFIFWDDYGGLYDPEPPAYVDYDGLGMRMPLLIVSPYARKGYVSHVHYEHGSILRFVEDTFGLPRLAASDKRAKSPVNDCFDFKHPPRKFTMIPTVYGKEFFLHQPPDLRAPDDD